MRNGWNLEEGLRTQDGRGGKTDETLYHTPWTDRLECTGKDTGGRQDIPLNAAGRSQAQMLAKGMEKRPVTAIYSSPQLRAMETAMALAGNQGWRSYLPELVEIGYGDWEGRTASDILTKERKLYEEWWQHPATVAPPAERH